MVAMRAFLLVLLALASTLASPTGQNQADSHRLNAVPINVSTPSFFDHAPRDTVSRRWDGSPAMGAEFQKAKNRGCTLWAQMHGGDAEAGKLFAPTRDSAHSDYLELSGKHPSRLSVLH